MNPEDQERVIEQWMMQVSQNGGVERYDHLHIDAIDPLWKTRGLWAEASLWAFEEGIAIRDRLIMPFTLGLGVSLEDNSPEIVGDIRLAELMARADWSSPSLYLFYPGQEPGNDSRAAIRDGNVEAGAVSLPFRVTDVPVAKSAVFLRFASRDSEVHNSAFLLG
ncbi:MAG TPA: hypothetical protein VIY53_09655 [Acidobacteriaceae bacterium]